MARPVDLAGRTGQKESVLVRQVAQLGREIQSLEQRKAEVCWVRVTGDEDVCSSSFFFFGRGMLILCTGDEVHRTASCTSASYFRVICGGDCTSSATAYGSGCKRDASGEC